MLGKKQLKPKPNEKKSKKKSKRIRGGASTKFKLILILITFKLNIFFALRKFCPFIGKIVSDKWNKLKAN